jgi:hypothetical protein
MEFCPTMKGEYDSLLVRARASSVDVKQGWLLSPPADALVLAGHLAHFVREKVGGAPERSANAFGCAYYPWFIHVN